MSPDCHTGRLRAVLLFAMGRAVATTRTAEGLESGCELAPRQVSARPALENPAATSPEPRMAAKLKTVPPPRPPKPDMSRREVWLRLAQVVVLLFLFLVGIRGLGEGFKGLGKDVLDSFFMATENPFMGLVVGMLATTLVQSSSVTTSMIVALVAAPDNPLPIQNAIPMIMGANIGTTVTATIVSLAHMGRPQEFRRAFEAATCHDFFNFITVGVLLPLELVTGYLSKSSHAIASAVGSGGPGKLPNPIKEATKIGLKPVEAVLGALSSNDKVVAVLMIIVSGLIIFGMLALIVKTLRVLAASRMKAYLTRSIGHSGPVGIVVGIVVTVMVQSSSITTSVLVPLAAAGMITLPQVFPITLGANVGTTITAILASMAAPAATAHLAVQIAMVHLLFNLSGIALIYPIERIRRIPMAMSEWLAGVAVKSKRNAVVFVLGVFYGLPALLVFVTRYI